jgi:hypothetical protein
MEWIKNIIANCTYHMQNRKEYLDWTTLHGISKLTELVNKALDAGHTGVWSYDDLNIMTMNGNKQPRYDVLARLDELRQYGWVQPKHVAKNEFKQNIKFKTREYNHLMDMLKYIESYPINQWIKLYNYAMNPSNHDLSNDIREVYIGISQIVRKDNKCAVFNVPSNNSQWIKIKKELLEQVDINIQ